MIKREVQRELGLNLQKARGAENLTREQLAEKAGISLTFLANLECGNKMMSVVTLLRLAEVLGVSADTLLYGERADNRLRNIEAMLRDQSPEMIRYIEALTRLSISQIPGIQAGTDCAGYSCGEVSDDVGP